MSRIACSSSCSRRTSAMPPRWFTPSGKPHPAPTKSSVIPTHSVQLDHLAGDLDHRLRADLDAELAGQFELTARLDLDVAAGPGLDRDAAALAHLHGDRAGGRL